MADDIARWLEGLGLSQYAQAFAENEIEFDLLPKLTDDDLKELSAVPPPENASPTSKESERVSPALCCDGPAPTATTGEYGSLTG